MSWASSEWSKIPEPLEPRSDKEEDIERVSGFPGHTEPVSLLSQPPSPPNVPENITEIVSAANKRKLAIFWLTLWIILLVLILPINIIGSNVSLLAHGGLLIAFAFIFGGCLLAWIVAKAVGPSQEQRL